MMAVFGLIKSANKVLWVTLEDMTNVIGLMYPQVSSLLKARLDTTWLRDHTFRARLIPQPKSQQLIRLIGAPVFYEYQGATLKAKSQGLRDIVTQV
jgi:hypothetical protein